MTEQKRSSDDAAQFMLGRISADVESLVRGMDEVKGALRDIPKVYATKAEVVELKTDLAAKTEGPRRFAWIVVTALASSGVAAVIGYLISQAARGGN